VKHYDTDQSGGRWARR